MTKTDLIQRHNVRVVGNPDAMQTMVFVHGFGTDQTAWQQVAAAFLPRFRLILFDHFGKGGWDQAQFPQNNYLALPAYARDLLDICEILDVAHCVAVGHSVGAMVASLAGIEAPNVVSKLVLIAASPRYLNDAGYHGGFTADDLDQLYSAVMRNFSDWVDEFAATALASPKDPELVESFAASLKKIRPEHALTVLCAIFQSDHRNDIAKLDVPTLILQSQNDLAVPLDVAR